MEAIADCGGREHAVAEIGRGGLVNFAVMTSTLKRQLPVPDLTQGPGPNLFRRKLTDHPGDMLAFAKTPEGSGLCASRARSTTALRFNGTVKELLV